MRKIITIGIVVLAASAAMAQKEEITPVNNNNIEAAQVKTHSNTNNNREAGNTPKLGSGSIGKGETGTKKKFDFGKLLKKK
jgi:hypothetical protein